MSTYIKIYADKECKNRVETIEWDDELVITLVTGEKKIFPNIAKPNQVATATVYLRNESRFHHGITKISLPDERLFFSIVKAWLEPYTVTKLTISLKVPKNPIPNDVIKAGKIEIETYYIYGIG